MSFQKENSGLSIDPRSKVVLLFLVVLSATMAPSLLYQMILVLVITAFGLICGKIRYSVTGLAIYIVICFLTLKVLHLQGTLQAMMIAFLGLVHKVYPSGILSGILLSTTKIGEFLSAMNRIHLSRKIVIPLAIMIRYIPTIREDWNFIKDAMRMRDVSPTLKGFLTRPGMTVECIYVPLMMAASKAADELTVASVTRGIENPKPRTSLVQIGFGMADLVAVICFLSIFLAGQFCKGVFL